MGVAPYFSLQLTKPSIATHERPAMSFVIRFDQDERKAFTRGLVKGMASPLMLFANSSAPALPRFEQVALPRPTSARTTALGEDWGRIGRDVRTVVQRHNGAK